jgi:hypothetical protein
MDTGSQIRMTGFGRLPIINPQAATSNPILPPLEVKGAVAQSGDLTQWQDSTGAILTAIDKNGGFVPASMSDATAANGTLYYSTTANKLVFKDSSGVVNNLY